MLFEVIIIIYVRMLEEEGARWKVRGCVVWGARRRGVGGDGGGCGGEVGGQVVTFILLRINV